MENAELSLQDRIKWLEEATSQTSELRLRDTALSYAIGATERGSGHVVITEYAQAFLNFLKG